MRQLLLTTCEGSVPTGSTRAAGTAVEHVGYAHGHVQVSRVHVERVMSTIWRDLPMNALAERIARPDFAKAPKAPRPPRRSP